jgi:hypothetical protein
MFIIVILIGVFLTVHGRDTSPDEIRLKIIKELVSHKDLYLNKEYLSRGLACPQKTILKSFATFVVHHQGTGQLKPRTHVKNHQECICHKD